MNNNYTYKEIMEQADALELVYKDVIDDSFDLEFLNKPYDEFIFFGCGTNYNLSQSASFFTKSLLEDKSCVAIPASELLFNTETYIKKNKKYLVFGFSRSGETTELINIVEKIKDRENITLFIFSAIEDSTLVRLVNNYFICRGSAEKSISMTKAFTSFLFAYCLILTKYLDKKWLLNEFKNLVTYLKNNMEEMFKDIENYLKNNDFKTCFVLGNGFNYGIAVEADLKMKEMAQVTSYSYHFHEFNHGPKTMVDENTLCFILNLEPKMAGIKLILETILTFGARVLVVDSKDIKDISDIKHEKINYLDYGQDFKSEFVKAFINIPIFQILAYIKAMQKNLDPDKPRNLSFTTKI